MKKTIERLMALAREDGDCMIWQGAFNESGVPMAGKDTVKRAAWKLTKGPIPAGKLVTSSCGCRACVNPDHLVLTTKAEVLKATNRRIDVAIRRKAGVTKTQRTRQGKINMEIARRIRADSRKLEDWAAELSCSISLVSLVRCNKSWVESAPSPWAGLGARSAA